MSRNEALQTWRRRCLHRSPQLGRVLGWGLPAHVWRRLFPIASASASEKLGPHLPPRQLPRTGGSCRGPPVVEHRPPYPPPVRKRLAQRWGWQAGHRTTSARRRSVRTPSRLCCSRRRRMGSGRKPQYATSMGPPCSRQSSACQPWSPQGRRSNRRSMS